MRQLVFLFFISLVSQTVLQAQNLENYMDSLSYSVGVLIAQNLKSQGLEDVDAESLAAAVNDVLKGNELKISQAEADQNFRKHANQQAAMAGKKNLEAGRAFLAENAKKAGVTSLESGIQYEVLQEGSGGQRPAATDEVTVHYHGTLIDGTVFDSSVERGQPATFPLNRVIPGWTETLQLMQIGDKWRIFLPSEKAYGERGAGSDIGPNSVLIFEVELLGIK